MGEGSEKIAAYGDEVLYRQELDTFMPDTLEGADSVRAARQYIDSWLQAQAVVEAARAQVPDIDEQVYYQARAYERLLTETAFIDYLIEGRAGQFQISEAEIANYYTRHPEKFISRAPYYQFFYIETAKPNQYRIVNLLRSDKPEERTELIDWCKENATSFKLDSSYVSEGGLEAYSEGFYYGSMTRASTTTVYPYQTQVGDTTYYRFFRMLKTIEAGAPLPLSLCRDRIAAILHHQRKQTLIDQTRANLLQQARAAGKIERYVE
ncbi:MAG: hypothetical protein OHK0039_45930 [Bacteroidia bacterium]